MPTSSHLHRITAKDTSIVWSRSNRRKRDLWNLPTLWFHTHWPLVSVDELLSLKLPTFNRISDRGMSWNTDNWFCFPLSNSTVWTLHYRAKHSSSGSQDVVWPQRKWWRKDLGFLFFISLLLPVVLRHLPKWSPQRPVTHTQAKMLSMGTLVLKLGRML